MPWPLQATALSGEDLISRGYPTVNFKEDYTTLGPSLASGPNFIYGQRDGFVEEWTDFVLEVKRTIQMLPPSNGIALALEPNGSTQASFMDREQLMCGEEKGIEGRFNHSVLHVVSGVALETRLPVVCGDFKATKRDISTWDDLPDHTGMTRSNHEIRFIGEAKADFKRRLYDHFTNSSEAGMQMKRKWLGQVFRYMRVLNLKYSFITTHFYTVFLKFEVDGTGLGHMYHSPPISARAFSTPTDVSTREGIYFLFCKASLPNNEWHLHYREPQAASGVKDNASSRGKPSYPPPGESSSGARRSQRDHGGGGPASGSNTYQVPHHYDMRYHADPQRVTASYDQRQHYPSYDHYEANDSKWQYQGHAGNQPPSYDLSEKLGSMTLHNEPQTKALRHVYVYEHLGKWFWEVQRGKSHKFKLKDRAFKIDRNTQQATLKIQGETFSVIVADEDRPAMFGT